MRFADQEPRTDKLSLAMTRFLAPSPPPAFEEREVQEDEALQGEDKSLEPGHFRSAIANAPSFSLPTDSRVYPIKKSAIIPEQLTSPPYSTEPKNIAVSSNAVASKRTAALKQKTPPSGMGPPERPSKTKRATPPKHVTGPKHVVPSEQTTLPKHRPTPKSTAPQITSLKRVLPSENVTTTKLTAAPPVIDLQVNEFGQSLIDEMNWGQPPLSYERHKMSEEDQHMNEDWEILGSMSRSANTPPGIPSGRKQDVESSSLGPSEPYSTGDVGGKIPSEFL